MRIGRGAVQTVEQAVAALRFFVFALVAIGIILSVATIPVWRKRARLPTLRAAATGPFRRPMRSGTIGVLFAVLPLLMLLPAGRSVRLTYAIAALAFAV
jgi:hypothetical protein